MMKTILTAAMTLGILTAAEPKIKVILDTDIGDDIDDAWALAFLLAHDGFEPVGVTAAHGNTPIRARIACKMLYQTGRTSIPVAVGRKTSDQWSYQYGWAEDFIALRPIGQGAASFLVEKAKQFPGQIVLVAVGPLENVADALRQDPGFGKRLRRVVLMSGCVYGRAGSPTPVAEYNVRAAVEDAQRVYSAGLPLTIVPLDSTTLVRLTEEERRQVRAHDSPLTRALESLYRLWIAAPNQTMTLHDQQAVAETARPGDFFAKKVTLPLRVDEKGFTVIDEQRGKPVAVCLEPKRDDFMRYYISKLVGQRLSPATAGGSH